MNISQNAVAAREAARSKTGEFGHQQHTESGIALSSGSTSLAAEHLDKLDWPVPDLSDEQQESTGLPADFAEAFDTYFAQAHQRLHAAGSAEAAVDRLQAEQDQELQTLAAQFPIRDRRVRLGEPEEGQQADGDGWYATSTQHGVELVHYMWASDDYSGGYHQSGAELFSDDPKAVQALQRARSAEETIHRVGQLEAIESGQEPVWSFLPATWTQTHRAQNVQQQYRGDLHQISQNLDGLKRTEWVVQHGGITAEEFKEKTREGFVWGTARNWLGDTLEGWREPDSLMEPMDDDALAGHIEDRAKAYVRDTERRSKLPSQEVLAAQQAEIEEKIRYYRQCAGWPGGDMSPQQTKDGSWYFYEQDSEGKWNFVDAPAKS